MRRSSMLHQRRRIGPLVIGFIALMQMPIWAEERLDRDSYRLKVETILEPTDKLAIYRVQVWTVDERKVSFGFEDWQVGQGGLPRRETDGKLYRTDFVPLFSLDGAEKGERDGKVELELRCMVNGSRGMFRMIQEVDASMSLSKLLDITL